ncbi:BA14K family protein [Sphingobium sp. YR768]|uniref:BA14K family protein n=1 Tax=Sphingobium sp. YR768 TaxID=1884365 RepID=UPI0008B2900C|nr:BA14K family protein [Sphingobium sp. YR768]SER44513.1 BA14K-like protein [Sphingobium sp. YR768]
MSRTPLLSLATLAALCAAASVQAQAPSTHGAHSAQAKTTAKTATKTAQKTQAKTTGVKKTGYSAHQKSCLSRYKSYNASSDTYLLKGKRVRCKL